MNDKVLIVAPVLHFMLLSFRKRRACRI